jgi:NADP-reducing hydrogenase subunit HndB
MVNKINNLEDLRKIKESCGDLTSTRSTSAKTIVVGMGTCGIAAGAREIMNEIMKELQKRGIKDVSVQTTGCIGMCQKEPLVDVIISGKERITYGNVSREDVQRIIAEHVVNGRIVEDLAVGRAD